MQNNQNYPQQWGGAPPQQPGMWNSQPYGAPGYGAPPGMYGAPMGYQQSQPAYGQQYYPGQTYPPAQGYPMQQPYGAPGMDPYNVMVCNDTIPLQLLSELSTRKMTA